MLIITHDMGVVAEIADEVVVMQQSRLVERGSVTDIFDRPSEPYTQSLLAAVPRLGSMAGHEAPQRFELIDSGSPAAERPFEHASVGNDSADQAGVKRGQQP